MTRKSERKRIRKELWVKYLKENPPEGYDVQTGELVLRRDTGHTTGDEGHGTTV
jgi:hypothetical protein